MRGVIDSSAMVIQSTTAWVSHHLCFLLCPDKGFGPFPDDILINILSRLPADAILRCRRVCRHWRSLTSSNDFIALQNERAPSVVLLVQCQSFDPFKKRGGNIYAYDDALARKLRKISFKSKLGFEGRAQQFSRMVLQGACGPLLHYKASGYYHWSWGTHNFAFNLITRQLGALEGRTNHSVCGLFFNEPRNEYNYLSAHWHSNGGCQFCVYDLDSRTDVKIACSPFLCGTYSNRSPVAVNGALYMIIYPIDDKNICMQAILAFEMDSGKFYTLPHPNFDCPGTKLHHLHLCLFVHDGHLCISSTDMVLGLLDIWILEDYANWHWVPLPSTISLPIPEDCMTNHRYVIHSMRKDELLVLWGLYLFLVNLKKKSVEEIKIPYKSSLDPSFDLVAYKSTLVAPRLVWDESIPPLFSL